MIIHIICGPTASGKSDLALKMAQEINGSVINADSMQVYDALKILSSSPKDYQKEKVPHYLYNFKQPTEKYSVANFIQDCDEAINDSSKKGYTPIIVGGTGLYIDAIINGISEIPPIDENTKNEVQNIIRENSIEELHNLILKLDPLSGAKLKKTDKQRIVRSLEVFLSTGKSIVEFQKFKTDSITKNFNVKVTYLKPERSILYEVCNSRFEEMIKFGAINEVEEFLEKYPNLNYGPINILGAKEIIAYLRGEISLDSAISLAQQKTRNYVKRQFTWFNNQLYSSASLSL